MTTAKESTSPVEDSTRLEGSENIVMSKQFVNSIYEYLNSRPRAEVNAFCNAIETAPTVTKFIEMVDSYYSNQGDK